MSQALNETKISLERLLAINPQTLARTDELGTRMSFEAAIPSCDRVLSLFRQISAPHLEEIPDNMLRDLRGNMNSAYNVFDNMMKFAPDSDPNANGTRNSLIDQANNLYDTTFSAIFPIISYLASRQRDFSTLEMQARAAVQSARDQANSLKEEMTASQNEAAGILDKIRQTAAEQGVSQQAIYFKEEADRHRQEADSWRIYTWIVAAIFFALALGSIFIYKIEIIKPDNISESISISVSKGLVFVAVGYVLFLCGRNFMFHTHNSIVNRHRQNALLTFNVLASSAKDDDRRDIVLTYAASCIFSPQETGYAKASPGQDSPTVKLIEIAPKIGGGGTPGH